MHRESAKKKLLELASEGKNKSRFTHAFMACGFLFDDQPRFSLSIEGRPARQIFDLASLSKALVTTPLVFRELSNAGLSLDDSLGTWLQKAKKSNLFSSNILNLSFRELLSHTSGLPAWRCLWVSCASETLPQREWVFRRLGHIASEPWASKSEFCYSDIGFILLGLCLEEVHQCRLSELFYRVCREDLEFIEPPILFCDRLDEHLCLQAVPTGFCSVRGRELCGEVHDENASMLGGIAGHAGAFGSGEAVLGYLKKLVRSEIGAKLIEENCKQRMPGLDKALLGWHQGAGESSRVFANGMSIGHLGFTGTAFWYVPEDHRYGILLTNRVISGRVAPWNTEFRRTVFSHFDTILA